MKKPTFKIYTLGCKVNQYDSKTLETFLQDFGFKKTEKNASVAIINTCSVTKTAIKKDKKTIAFARRENPKAKIVLMGCFPKIYKNELENLKVDLIWGVGNLEKLSRKVCELLDFSKSLEGKAFHSSYFEKPNQKSKSRYFLKIQDGCEQFCSYCIIPFTRGKLKSSNFEEVIDEAKKAVKNGFREIILCGIHLGLFNKEKNSKDKRSLVELLKELVKIKDLGRARLSSIEATEVTGKLLELMSENKKICPHLHLPLQAGSNKILKAMNRPYNKKFFEDVVKKARKLMPKIAITADVIVGFPGETKGDFKETCEFVKKMAFSKTHVFSFSAHEKTKAEKMENKIEKSEIKRRSKVLREIGEKFEKEYKKKITKEKLSVVLEVFDEKKEAGKGRSEYYFEIKFDKSNLVKNKKTFEKDIGKIFEICV